MISCFKNPQKLYILACCLIVFGGNHVLAQADNSNISTETFLIDMEYLLQSYGDEIESSDLMNECIAGLSFPMGCHCDIILKMEIAPSLLKRSDAGFHFSHISCRTGIFITGPPDLLYLKFQFFTYA